MKFEKKDFVTDLAIGILIFVMGMALLISFKQINDIKQIFFVIMISIGLLKFVQYICVRELEKRNYESLFWTISCVLGGASALVFKSYNTNYVIAITLLVWTSIIALVKLIAIDKMVENNDEGWKIKIFDFIVFILISIVCCINLFYKVNARVIILGFYFCLLGITELLYPFVGLVVQDMMKNNK